MNTRDPYRNSYAHTGRACRTTSERWPDYPVRAVRPGFWYRLLLLITGH
jgi:hypothetical protein